MFGPKVTEQDSKIAKQFTDELLATFSTEEEKAYAATVGINIANALMVSRIQTEYSEDSCRVEVAVLKTIVKQIEALDNTLKAH